MRLPIKMEENMKLSVDAIINLVILLIVIWSFISKLRKKKNPEPANNTSDTPQGIREIIGELIHDLSEIDTNKKTPDSKQSQWNRVISDKPLPLPETDSETETQAVLSPPPLPSAEKRAKAQKPLEEKDETSPKPEMSVCQEDMLPLKQAVIWSEILGSPVSLRK
jgi:hypothetical protein